LADLSGVDRAVIERIEVAVQPPTLETIRKLAVALVCPLQALTTDDRPESESDGEEAD